MRDINDCTDKDFDIILKKLIKRDVDTLLLIPGVYESLSEHYNNEILEIWENSDDN